MTDTDDVTSIGPSVAKLVIAALGIVFLMDCAAKSCVPDAEPERCDGCMVAS